MIARVGCLRPGIALICYHHMGEWFTRRIWMHKGELMRFGPIPADEWTLAHCRPFPSFGDIFGLLGCVQDAQRRVYDWAIYHAMKLGHGREAHVQAKV